MLVNMNFCNAGHTGVIQQLTRHGFYLSDFGDDDDDNDIENLLMKSDQLHYVSILSVNAVFSNPYSD